MNSLKGTDDQSQKFQIALRTRYILSFLGVLTIPLVILGGLVTGKIYRVLETETRELSRNRLISMKQVVEKDIEGIVTLYFVVSGHDELLAVEHPSAVRNQNMIQRLNEYVAVNSFIQEILFIPYEGDRLYTSHQSFEKTKFLPHFETTQALEAHRFYQDIHNTLSAQFIADFQVDALGEEKKIAIVLPFPLEQPEWGNILFLAEPASLERSLGQLLDTNAARTALIMDQSGQLIAQQSHDESVNLELLQQAIFSNLEAGESRVTDQGQDYFLSWTVADRFGWIFVYLVPDDHVLASTREMGQFIMISVVVVVLLEALLIYWLLQILYTPLKRLKEATEESLGVELGPSNELKAMMEAVDLFSEEKRLSEPARREFLLFNTLKGRIRSREEFNLKGREIGLVFHHHLFVVVVLQFSDCREVDQKAILEWLASENDAQFDIYLKDPLKGSTFIFLVSCDDQVALEQGIAYLHQEVTRLYGPDFSAGVGNLYSILPEISKSYMEASIALDYRLVKGSRSLIYFHQVASEGGRKRWYSHDDLQTLTYAIKRGDQGEIRRQVNKLIQGVSRKDCPLYVAKGLSYEIFQTVLGAIEDMGYSSILPYTPDGTLLERFDSLDDLSTVILELCDATCGLLKEKEPEDFPDLEDQLLEYVEAHYTEKDFYAQRMAAHFSLSPPYLSQFFRNKVGENLKDYVLRLKIRHAKELLSDTQMPIKDIVDAVGYGNFSSFSRKFRNSTGMSPREFRRQAQGDGN
ncbi:MAG: helix-turn-helix domain-containing protein [Spirochaetales bacterium]|nr:helix-turn-helix domain-containing protein [Spirochaetales bacterium]